MNHRLLRTIITLGVLTVAHDAAANLTGSRATPRQQSVVASAPTTLSINWRVSATIDHTTGVSSADAIVIDPASGATLFVVPRTFNAVGAGPFSFREIITLDPVVVRSWIDRGSTRVVLQRTFFDPAGSITTATAILTLSRSRLLAARSGAQDSFAVQALRLEFDTGNNTDLVTAGDTMRASLTVMYNGTGMLHGRWQIAEPGSSEAAPLYRTLALVNTNLATSQRSVLRSPALPTDRSGKYVLRFCVTNRLDGETGPDAACPNTNLVATATYQVQGAIEDSLESIKGLAPDRVPVSAATPFSWQPLASARVYQLQIFSLGPSVGDLPSSRQEHDAVEPRFVGGMLLKPGTTNTPLSESALGKLEPGHRYLWRVTAHDESGRMIGKSDESSFVYEPGE